MVKPAGPRTVQCYHCRHRFEVGRRAESTACPKCAKSVIVGDVIVTRMKPVTKVQTCGRVIVKKSGRVIAKLIEAHGGVEVEGVLDAEVLSGGPVLIGKKAEWKGDLRAPSLEVKLGARITKGYFIIPNDPLGLADLIGEG